MDCVGDWSVGHNAQHRVMVVATRSFVVSDSEKFGGECPNRNKIKLHWPRKVQACGLLYKLDTAVKVVVVAHKQSLLLLPKVNQRWHL